MDFVCLKEDFVDNLKSENNFSTLDKILDENSRSSYKCGEIFISEEEVFNFLCTLCEAPFEDVDKFFVHVKSIHKNTNGHENLDPLKQNVNQYQCEKIKSESQSISIIQQNSIDNLNSNSPKKVSNPYDEDILKEELLSESGDEVNEKSSSERVCDTDEDETWNKTNKNAQNNETRIKFRSNNLNEHKQKYSAGKNTDLLCDICSKGFKTLYTLRRHLKNIHNIVRTPKNNNSPVETELRSQSTSVLMQLESTYSKNIEEDKNNSFYSEKISNKCKYCDRQFKEKSKLEEHETIYCGDKPSECQTCGKQFTTKARLRRHEKIHTDIREYKCDICQSAFKSKSGLYSHMLRHGEKKYSCDYCTKRFVLESEKREHERVHTGERPFQCNYCGKCFQTRGSLSTHVKSHTGRRPHKCQYCDKCFYTKALLNNHIVIHTGERPFVCLICKATFPRQKALRSHEKIHSDLKAYVCKICGEAFKQYAGLYCHKKSHGQPFKKQIQSQC